MKSLLKISLVIVMISGSLLLFAQDSLLTAEDAIYMNRDIYPASISQLQWVGQTNYYAYAKEDAVIKAEIYKEEKLDSEVKQNEI